MFVNSVQHDQNKWRKLLSSYQERAGELLVGDPLNKVSEPESDL